MQLDAFAEPDGSCGKTSQEHSAATGGQTLLPWLAKWLDANSVYRETDGKAPELLLGRTDSASGACWTRNTSDWPKDAAVCLLSSILETGTVDSRFYLSPKACAGILRRAEKRGKSLPQSLAAALQAVASEQTSTATEDCESQTQ
jgi:hypothetical protein